MQFRWKYSRRYQQRSTARKLPTINSLYSIQPATCSNLTSLEKNQNENENKMKLTPHHMPIVRPVGKQSSFFNIFSEHQPATKMSSMYIPMPVRPSKNIYARRSREGGSAPRPPAVPPPLDASLWCAALHWAAM